MDARDIVLTDIVKRERIELRQDPHRITKLRPG
jgi:hypothetical protein